MNFYLSTNQFVVTVVTLMPTLQILHLAKLLKCHWQLNIYGVLKMLHCSSTLCGQW